MPFGKSLREANALMLLETSRHQPGLCPDHIAMLVGFISEHPLRRYDVRPVWFLRRAERPRVRQVWHSLSIAHFQVVEYWAAHASSYVFGVERSPTGRVGMCGVWYGDVWWNSMWPIPSRIAINGNTVTQQPLPRTSLSPRSFTT